MQIYCYYSSSRVTDLGWYSVMGFSFGWLPHLARYLLWLDTSFGQILPLAGYILWLDSSFDQIPPLARYILWLDTSFGQIHPLARFLLWLDTFNMVSPPETYPLWQHILSGNISLTVTYLLRQHRQHILHTMYCSGTKLNEFRLGC